MFFKWSISIENFSLAERWRHLNRLGFFKNFVLLMFRFNRVFNLGLLSWFGVFLVNFSYFFVQMFDNFIDWFVRNHHFLMMTTTLIRSSGRKHFCKLNKNFVVSSNFFCCENLSMLFEEFYVCKIFLFWP